MEPAYKSQCGAIYLGDCAEILQQFEDNSVDAVVTDPPYGYKFMGKKWDYDVPSVETWRQILRVLKPGGHLLSFGGARTYHRLVVNVEDAGFEIRDQIQWIYSQGFPKSQNVSKQIDKQPKANDRLTEFANMLKEKRKSLNMSVGEADKAITGGTSMYSFFEGRNLNGSFVIYPPNQEHYTEICKAFGISGWDDIIENNLEKVGTEEGNFGYQKNGERWRQERKVLATTTDSAQQWEGWGTAIKPANEPIVLARKPIAEKNIAQNVLKWGTGAVNIDECRIEGGSRPLREGDYKQTNNTAYEGRMDDSLQGGSKAVGETTKGRFPANVIHDGSEEVTELFPETGVSSGGKNKAGKFQNKYGEFAGNNPGDSAGGFCDSGSAARFFKCCPKDPPRCLTCAKANDIEVADHNRRIELWKHSTVTNAEKNGKTIQATNEFIARASAIGQANESLVLRAKFAESLCDLCATSIVVALVGIKTLAFNNEELQAILDSIGKFNGSILAQNLASFAELWGNTDTIPTTASLSILFGSVRHAIENSIKQTEKGRVEADNDQETATRFKYVPKANKKDRGENNDHPTVKPQALIRYLVTLITPPGGTVLDPFMGSGTLPVVCEQDRRSYVAIDKDKHSVEIATDRLQSSKRQKLPI